MLVRESKPRSLDVTLKCLRFRYNDTPDEDWIIGRHPENPSIILATGGSGHAFKVVLTIIVERGLALILK